MNTITQPIKWPGGKHYLASRIAVLMPAHRVYVEPFAGGLSVLLAKSPLGVSEVVNDRNGDLVNFWGVLRDPVLFEQFKRRCEATPFCEEIWENCCRFIEDFEASDLALDDERRVMLAWCFFVVCRQSLAGRQTDFASLSTSRVRRGMNEQVSAWLTCIDGLATVHERLKRVVILNREALDVIQSQDGPETLHYCDPPYLHETRNTTDEYGDHEMSREDHQRLLGVLLRCKGKVMLSGYDNALYENWLSRWNRHDFSLPNNAAAGKVKRRMTECLWCNW